MGILMRGRGPEPSRVGRHAACRIRITVSQRRGGPLRAGPGRVAIRAEPLSWADPVRSVEADSGPLAELLVLMSSERHEGDGHGIARPDRGVDAVLVGMEINAVTVRRVHHVDRVPRSPPDMAAGPDRQHVELANGGSLEERVQAGARCGAEVRRLVARVFFDPWTANAMYIASLIVWIRSLAHFDVMLSNGLYRACGPRRSAVLVAAPRSQTRPAGARQGRLSPPDAVRRDAAGDAGRSAAQSLAAQREPAETQPRRSPRSASQTRPDTRQRTSSTAPAFPGPTFLE